MANRYDIIRIDFQASARGANTAIESIRKEAEDCNTRISELKKNIAEAPKNGTDAKVLEGWNEELKATEKRFKQFNTAYKELVKGMRALDEGVKMFNDGSLQEMNAAFQKTVNNAAKLAQSKLKVGTDEWRQMGALMQETEQNYARMQRDTDQLIESLQNGGTVFRKTLEDEKKGLQDLLQVLPYMGTEYRKAQEQLDFLVKKTDEMIVKERQMKGEIVTTDDARRVSLQLTKEGAEAARQRATAADEEIENGKQVIATLEKEQEVREKDARESAQAAATYRENQRMYEDEIERLDKEIKRENDLANSKKNGTEALRKKAEQMKASAEDEKKTQQELDGVYDAAKEKAAKLREEVEKMRQGATGAPSKDSVAEAVKTGAEEASEAVKKETDETKKKTEAKKEEAKAGEKAVETQNKEKVTVDSLMKSIQEQETVLKGLREERDKLAASQKQGAQATKEETNAFKDLTKEQAQAMLEQKQALATFKNEGGQMKVTNREEAQRFLFDSLNDISGKLGIEGSPEKVNELLSRFKSRYGLQSDDEAMSAVRGLMSGGLVKSGFMNKQFLTLEQDTANISTYKKGIEQLTAVINGETKATEENVEAKRTLADIDADIAAKEKEQRENVILLRRLREGEVDVIDEVAQKNGKLAESHRQNTEAIKKQIEAIKQMNREQAETLKKEMMAKSTLDWKAGKPNASNLEELQHWIITQAGKKGTIGEDGKLTLKGQNIDKLLADFHKRYGTSGDPSNSADLFKQIIKGGSGLFDKGGSIKGENLTVNINKEAYDARLEKFKAIFDITNKTANATKKSTDATKDQTNAIDEQLNKVEELKRKWEEAKAEHKKYNDEYNRQISEIKRLKKGSFDEQLAAEEKEAEAETYKETYVDPAYERREQYKRLHSSANNKLKRMQTQGQETDETKKNTEAENNNAEATESATKSKRGKKKASEEAAKATGEETQKSAELITKEKELEDAETAEATAKKNAEEQQKRTTKAINDAEAAVTKADEAEKKHVETTENLNKERQENVDGLKKLNEANKDTIATNEKNQKLLDETNGKIREQGEKIRDAERIKAQANTEGIEKTEQAIRLLTEENRRIGQNSSEWEENTRIIQHLQAALDEMKNKPALMMMTDRMQDVSKLSTAAVTETRKFWEAMVAGSERGSKELAEYEGHLKTITEEEQKRSRAALEASAKRLNGNLGNLSQDELRQAINDAKLLQSTYKSTSKEARELAQAIVNAEDHVRRYGVEAERAARKQEEADRKAARAARDKEEADRKAQQEQHTMMQQRAMLERNRTTLSAAALAETKKYWQAVKDGAEEGSVAQRNALRIMEKITAEEQRRNTAANAKKAGILSGTLSDYSEGEIREAIEAGKQLILTYKSGSKEAKDMGKAIAEAEEHIKNVGLDAQRTAVRQEQAIAKIREEGAEMVEKAKNGEFATASMDDLDKTIKKLKEYQALIKDPNDAGKEAFEATKEQVDALTEQLNKLKGVTENVNGSFKDADEVLARFGEHMNAGKTASDGMAQSLDEKLAGKTSSYDEYIERNIKSVEQYEQEIQEATQELADMEKELAELEAKHKNSSWFRKKTKAYRQEGWRIEDLRDEIEGHEAKMDDGSTFRTGQKQWIEDLHGYKQNAQEWVDYWKKQKADELGITEEVEEKKQEAQRLTQEQMQEGIKLLEEEYRKTDHTTAEGIKRREQLRQTIDQMNQEIKESTGEWMSYAEAEKFAAQAGTEGFIATGQQMQQAQQALERQRDSLIKSIQTKRQEKDMTDEQKKALAAEEAQLDKVNAELKKMKFEMDNTNMSAKRMNEILDNPSAAKNIEELGQAVKRAQAQLKVMEDTVGDTNKEYQEMAQKTKEAAQRQKELEVQFKASASAFDKAWSRLKTYVGLYVGASVAMNKLVGTMGDLMDLSDKMGEVRKTTGFTADEVGRLSGELKKMDTRTALNGLLDLSVAAGQLGLKTEEDVLGFTEAANKLMVALPEMGREGATEMLKVALATGEIDKIRKQMEQGLIEGSSATAVAMEKVGSTIDRLRATSAATAPAITDFVKRVGAVGAQSGISIDQVAALGSTVDALGMRVEMSATALSRMIPAIKNNAFDVAKAIGVAPEYLRGLFDEAGGGMKAMLMIFQHIKDSGMSEDNIEKMLGMGNLKEIMKELNQQGARAGIVFSGLSQNVDTLREHLSTASDAYRENVAIQQEYEKMNETTMAKWERLKNEIEEMFVGDGAQRFLGGIIDGIREIVDLLTGPLKGAAAGLGAGLSAYRLGLGSLLEKMWDFARGEEDVTEKWKEWTEKLKDKDVWGIVTSGVIAAGVAIYTYVDSLQEAAREAAKFARDVVDEQNKVENLTKAIGDAKTKVEEADKEVEKARKAVDEAKKSLDGTKESTDRLTEANSKLLVSEEKKRNEMATQKKLIETFNNEYGKYLGFMLSEVSSNYELIKARDLANTKLRETIALKRKEAALGRIEESEGEGRDEAYAALSQAVSGSIRKQVVTGRDKNGKEIKTWANDQEATTRLLRNLTKMAQAQNMTAREVEKALADAGLNIYEKRNGKQQINAYGANLRNLVMNYRNEYQTVQSKIRDVETQFDVEASIDREEAQGKLKEQFKASEKNYAELETSYAKAQGDARKQAAANLLKQADTLEEMISAAPNYYDLSNDTEKAAYEKFVTDTQKRIDGIKEQREALLKEAGTLYKSRKTVQGETTTSLTPTSPWGGNAPADSTEYGTWDVNELVARRNQMDKFKNVLKPDTDIRAVLAEDKALMKALDNGLKEDWKSVLGWYNTERKKIQEELKSERFSTNEGHWRDEKQGRGRRNRFRESDYALAELDRYYSKRKEDLEKARIEENMSEELFNRQAELLEQEHLERRSKLRETFTAGSTEQEKKMVKQFREWWSQLEKQGLLDEVPWATVESEWSKALASEIGRNNLRAQQDLTKLQEITVKHLNEIAKLIDKERPYDGITANLRKNLTEMDILLADMQKDGPEKDTAKLVKAETIRLKFLLSEAEQAYSLDFEQLKEKMVKEGFGEWAQAIEGDEQLKQSLMQNLRNTYDAIQEAIKKESSVIKKQLEIQWNDMLPGSDMSMKGTFEKAVSDLGLAGDQVKRANSLIGAGTASDRVADKLAIQQMRIQLQMQETYFALMQKIGRERIKQLEQSAVANEREAKALKEKAELLRKEGKTAEAEVTELKAQNALRQSLQDKFDAEHAAKSLSLARTKELAEEEKQRVAIANQLEESQNRLYQELKSWADLLASSLQGVFEASHAGDREYYNERAKMDLTGKGGPGAGTYIVIEDEGTDDARAHYEYMDERQALERQREIENDNAMAEAWKKVFDDLNQKMSETITDQLNAMLQSQSIDANTQAVIANTEALWAQLGQGGSSDFSDASKLKRNAEGMAVDESGQPIAPIQPTEVEQSGGVPKAPWQMTEDELAKNQENMYGMWQAYKEYGIAAETEKAEALAEIPGYTPSPLAITEEQVETVGEIHDAMAQKEIDASKKKTEAILADQQKVKRGEQDTQNQMVKGSQSTFAKMTAAANLYGIAYQTMSNDNLSAAQKFELFALQAAGQAAISMLTTDLAAGQAKNTVQMPGILGKLLGEMPYPAAIATFAAVTALMGGLMGLAVSQVAKSKSQISQVTGSSMNAGRLSTGMLTYKEGNVNEFTDPSTLTPGRHYNVDAADGRTYRAKYTGTDPKTHITSGPEFHLVGERGPEAIIDAKTTRQIRMDDNGIWQSIQTLYNGGRISASRRRRAGRGMAAFADGNLDEFEEIGSEAGTGDGGAAGMGAEQMAAFQSSLDRNNELLERALTDGIHARFDVYGKGGLIDSYDTGKKTVSRHGEKY